MNPSLLIRVALVLGFALALVGCGGGSKSSHAAAAGAKVFRDSGCAGCHTLADAHARGKIGPDLDQLKLDYDTVVRQVSNGGNGMPSFAGRLNTGQIRDVALYVAAATKRNTTVQTEFHPDSRKLSGCHGDYACSKQAFGNLAYRNGPRDALAKLAAEMRTNSMVSSGCHQIAHEIGHAAFARYHGNAAEALANGSMTCWSGYYHGVIERAFGGVPRQKVTAVARRLCTGSAIRRTLFLAYQCVHGLGHGLMIYSGNDLPYSLRVCDELSTAWDQTSCTGGVFMQNFLPGPMQIGKTKWVRGNDLIYPCDTVRQRDKLYCYLMVTSRILPVVGYDWRKAAHWCRRAERGWIVTCFQSFGRDASGWTVQNPRRIVSICRVAGDMQRECLYGAARDLTSNDANGRRAARMCALAPASARAYCFYGIGTILGNFKPDTPGRRAECAATTRRYLADCLRGAGG